MGRVVGALSAARRAQGRVEGMMAALHADQALELAAEAWSCEAVSTAAIEGESLDLAAVRSSVARRLGAAHQDGPDAPRHVEGLLDVMQDAVLERGAPVTHERLHAWQAALFPGGFSSGRKIRIGAYRQHAEPMQIVSGAMGLQAKVHYEAPPSARVHGDMDQLLAWFNSEAEPDAFVKAALVHLWFETIHPFEDGNGRVGRVLVDLVLARDMGRPVLMLRPSQRLQQQRKAYYQQLEQAQRGGTDVTEWVLWFIEQMRAACDAAAQVINETLAKALFWFTHRDKKLNERQRKVINRVLMDGPDSFKGGLDVATYLKITKEARAAKSADVARVTASRDLSELKGLGLLVQTGAGRATRYHVNLPGWGPDQAD
ncbi:Fic family protein [Azohydromonas sp. G-1-1-14]|uniref:Fic family protein n=2 Tax=Azohydromonas caseinilytica TaxID=2728836 RepID=A0A848FGN7_9BURK|nr:Fic family protein [Azohydromonas caseinilytica]